MSTTLGTVADCVLHEVGHDWDAVRVPLRPGLLAMAILGSRCGAAMEAPNRGSLYYFVTRGAATDWDVEGTQALGEGVALAIPPAQRTEPPGPFWRVCPGNDGWITDARALRAALEDAESSCAGQDMDRPADQEPLDLPTMRASTRPVLGREAQVPPPEDLETLTLRLRGHLMVAIPELEKALAHLPEDDVPRACALAGIREARTRLDLEADPSPAAGFAHAQRLARSVNALCDHYENLRKGD